MTNYFKLLLPGLFCCLCHIHAQESIEVLSPVIRFHIDTSNMPASGFYPDENLDRIVFNFSIKNNTGDTLMSDTSQYRRYHVEPAYILPGQTGSLSLEAYNLFPYNQRIRPGLIQLPVRAVTSGGSQQNPVYVKLRFDFQFGKSKQLVLKNTKRQLDTMITRLYRAAKLGSDSQQHHNFFIGSIIQLIRIKNIGKQELLIPGYAEAWNDTGSRLPYYQSRNSGNFILKPGAVTNIEVRLAMGAKTRFLVSGFVIAHNWNHSVFEVFYTQFSSDFFPEDRVP